MITVLALSAAAHGLTPQDITPEFCEGVPQELNRVQVEFESAEGRLQREWLKRQIKALTLKHNLCVDAKLIK
tara:strand:- start:219 stop:434 length:216 start_codon:yes stop_codon:yes gene_type:complete